MARSEHPKQEEGLETNERKVALSFEAIRAAQQHADEARYLEFAVDLAEPRVRRRLAFLHPMLEDGYIINTSQVDEFRDVVYDFVAARLRGLYVVGSFRMGKSKAIDRARRYLEKHLPNLAVLCFIGERKPGQTKPQFCRAILESWGVPVIPRQSVEDLLCRYLMTRAVLLRGRTVVLFIDEAQMLTVTHFRYLLEIWNALGTLGILLVTVLVGQESLDDLKKLTTDLDHGAVDARFFRKRHSIDGVASEAELKTFMAAYDKTLSYPDESWPYTRFFLCRAFDEGFRLANSADMLWAVLLRAFPRPTRKLGGKKTASSGIRMDVITASIHSFLIDTMKSDAVTFKASMELWETAVLSAIDSITEG